MSNSIHGAQASAKLNSLIEAANANGRESYHDLRHNLKVLPAVQLLEDIETHLIVTKFAYRGKPIF